jgi:tetratricopeptide (TPR) repeat protein/tRNA A-37 threonylcarbamoyl transferase component Bud32
MSSTLERLRDSLPAQYEVERELASGGMGTVYLARDTVLDRRVAVKVHRPDLTDPTAGKRLLEEARILARLRHPNVVSIYHAGEFGESFYYIMDYVEGETLGERIKRGPLGLDEGLKLGSGLLSALEAVHADGIVHRDIKPGNIFLVDDHALLGDFGIAKHHDRESGAITEPGQRMGTPGHMAPEQATGGEVTTKTDLYAVGMVLYDALSGRQWSMLTPVKEADWSGIPEPVARVLRKSLAMSPDDRWSDATAFKEALSAAGAGGRSRRAVIVSRLLAAALGLSIVAGAAWALRDLWMPVSLPVSETRIAVLPFSVRGNDAFNYLGEGMVDLLSTKLDGAGELRSADPRAVLSLVEQENLGVPDPDEGRGIARGLGAGLYVLGNIVEVQGTLQLDASLYDPEAGLEAVANASAEGPAGQLFELVDRVAAELLVSQARESGGPARRIAEVTTSSIPALKAYLEGEQAFRAGDHGRAAEAFGRATQLDSTFALAWYRLGITAEWLVRSDVVERSAEQAFRHSSRLSEHDQNLFRAFRAYRDGNALEAERLYRAILATHPDDVGAWAQLGELLFHYGPYYGRPISEAREPFERVLFFEPDEVHALAHLMRITTLEDAREEADELASRYLELHPEDDRALEIRALRAFAIDDEPSQRQVLSELRLADVDELMIMTWSVPVHTRNIDGAASVISMLADDASRPQDVRAMAHTVRAALRLAQGRWRDAESEFDAAAVLDPVVALEYRALLAAHPLLAIGDDRLEAIRGELEDWDASDWRPSSTNVTWVNAHDEAHSHLRLYLLGLLSVRLGNLDVAERYAAELEQLSGTPEVMELAHDLALGIRAQGAIVRGQPEVALDALQQGSASPWYAQMSSSLFFSQALERFTRAELLAATGRDEEAIRWFDTLAVLSSREMIYLAPSHLRRAEIYERLGDGQAAEEHYERFIELWRDCDPELRPLVDYAAERLTLLATQEHR